MKRKVSRPQVLSVILLYTILAAVLFPVVETILAERYLRQRAMCIVNLHYITEAKARWAYTHEKIIGDDATFDEVFGPHASNAVAPQCPSGGAYSLGEIGTRPRCSLAESHAHQFSKTPLR